MNSNTGRRKTSFRWSLRTMLAIVFAVSTWLAFLRLQMSIPLLQADIDRMESLLPNSLSVVDPAEAAAVHLPPTWYDEHIWMVYLPPGQEYRLQLASRDIDGDGLAPSVESVPLTAGTHQVELVRTEKVESQWRTEVVVDGESSIVCEEALDWNEGSGSTGGSDISRSQQFSPDKEIILFRRRWLKKVSETQSRTPDGPCEGLLLWIAPADSAAKEAHAEERLKDADER